MLKLKNITKVYTSGDEEVKALKGVDIEFRESEFVSILGQSGCGKTTLLRDMVRQLSNGKEGFFEGQTVGVADERGEVAGCYKGVAQNDVGIRTDVLDCCPKAEGMLMLVRSMSPRIIAVDEIGKKEDFVAILKNLYFF